MIKKYTKQILILIAFVAIGGGAFVATEAIEAAAPERANKVRFLPHWLPQAQFAGYYMAQKQGIYAKHGIDIEILTGKARTLSLDDLRLGSADFSTSFLSSAIKSYDAGNPIVNICQLSGKSALLFVAKKSSGIQSIADLNGKRIGIWKSGFQEVPLAFLQSKHIKAEIVPIKSTVNLFLQGGVDVLTVMTYNEYHQLINSGLNEDEMTVFALSDNDFNVPEDGIYCSRELWDSNPDLCQRFVRATIEGWKYAFDHEEEALDEVLARMYAEKIPANRAHQRWQLRAMKDLYSLGGELLSGKLRKEDFKLTVDILLQSGAIKETPSFRDFFKGESK